MVRKLRKHNVYMNYPKVAELQADEEHKPVEVFVPTKPIKSDLQEVLGHGEHRKIELLTERYQMRITELEKEVIGVPSGKRGITTLRNFETLYKPLILLRL